MEHVIKLTDRQMDMIGNAREEVVAAEERAGLIVNAIVAGVDCDVEGAAFVLNVEEKTLTITVEEPEED